MAKIVIAPSSFRGSLNVFEVTEVIAKSFQRAIPEANILQIPIADGGESTIDVLLNKLGGKKIYTNATNPIGQRVDAQYGILSDGVTAIIEISAASGIELVPLEQRNPMIATSFGTGELIKHALDQGCRRLIIGLGGSATVDGGAGMLQALGVRLLNERNGQIEFGGAGLEHLVKIDVTNMDPRIQNTEIHVIADISNVLTGSEGAALMIGPQKGATPEMVSQLDANLNHFAQIIRKELHKDILDIRCGGASGGAGAALNVFLHAKLELGIDFILKTLQFEKLLTSCNLVVTGEGKLDKSTLKGKAPYGVAKFAHEQNIPVIIITGQIDEMYEMSQFSIFDVILSICNRPMSLQSAMQNAADLVSMIAEQAGKLFLIGIQTSKN